MDVSENNEGIPLAYLFFKEGFNLTGYECAGLLEVSERYLFESLKQSFEYVRVKRKDTQCFKPTYFQKYYGVYATEIDDLAEIYGADISEYLKFLLTKKIFINRDSFKEFLRSDLKVVSDRIRFNLPEDIIPDNITKKEIAGLIELSPKIHNTPYPKPLDDDLIDRIITGAVPLYSPKALKQFVEVDGLTVYDTQLYRWINGRASIRKLHLTTVSTDKPVVRYIFDTTELDYFRAGDMYSVDSRCYYDDYVHDLTIRILNYSTDKSRGYFN